MIYELHSKPHTLKHHDKLDTHHPDYVWSRYEHDPIKLKQLEHLWAKSARYAYIYASETHRAFTAGEEAISKSTEYSYLYARDVLKGPFPAGEDAISQNSYNAYMYASYILKKPFPKGEPAISKHAKLALDYAKYVTRKPFPLAEKSIFQSDWNKRQYLEMFPERDPDKTK
jgi:hypothetical protein